MVEFSRATVGSLNGEGQLDVSIIGENIFEKISCNWNLTIGYIIFTGPLILSFIALFFEKKKK